MKEKRRDFLKKVGLLGLGSAMAPTVFANDRVKNNIIVGNDRNRLIKENIEPTQAQKEWEALKFGMFIHFGINTYYDKEWSDGTLDPSKYNPTELDTDQWCSVASQAGMKYIVLVTKHHDGFCNWPTQYTDYSVKSTPYKGDLVAEVVNSAHKYGLKVGLYYSLWDRREKSHDTNEPVYVEFMINQLNELLNNYGSIVELWFDGMWKKHNEHWKDADGNPVSSEQFVINWRHEGAFRWQIDRLYQYIKQQQPNCLVMNNATTGYAGTPLHPVDILSGEKATKVEEYKRVWNWLGHDRYFPMQIEATMSKYKCEQFSGSWFWHEKDHTKREPNEIKEWLRISKEMNANLLLNCGPMANGKLRPEDVESLTSLK